MKQRPISIIAREIQQDWKRPYFGAVPYINAMMELNSINDIYISENAKSIVLYFLSNAASWRGDKAKAIKAELKALVNAPKTISMGKPFPRR